MNQLQLLRVSYRYLGLYDLLLGIPLLILPGLMFSLFHITTLNPSSPFVLVTGSTLLVIGVLLISAAKTAEEKVDVGYSTVFVRLSYAIIFVLRGTYFHWIFVVFIITDGLTGLFLLVLLLRLRDIEF